MAMTERLFIECVKKIKRYPSVTDCVFPSLPNGCFFVLCPPSDGRYKIEVNGDKYNYGDYLRLKSKIKKELSK